MNGEERKRSLRCSVLSPAPPWNDNVHFPLLDRRYQAPSHVTVNSWRAETVQGDVEVATSCTSNRPLSHILTGSIPSDSASPLVGPSKPVPGFSLPGRGRDDPSRRASGAFSSL